jgi:hypothetical protein
VCPPKGVPSLYGCRAGWGAIVSVNARGAMLAPFVFEKRWDLWEECKQNELFRLFRSAGKKLL